MSQLPYRRKQRVWASVAILLVSFGAERVGAEDGEQVEPPAIEVLLKDQTDSLFRLSPDGSMLARVIWYPAGFYLSVIKTEDGTVQQEVPLGKRRPQSLYWLGKRRLLYASNGNIFATNIDGTDHAAMLSRIDPDRGKNYRKNLRFWQIKHLLPDDPEHILVQSWNSKSQPAIVRANIYTGEEEELIFEPRLNIQSWAIDRDGDVRLGIRIKKDKLQFLAFDYEAEKWAVYDNYAQDGANTLGHTGETFLTKRISLEEFDYDNDHIYMATNIDSDRFKIVRYNIAERRVVDDVYASDRYDVGGNAFDGTVLLFNDVTEQLIGIRLVEDRVRTVWFDEQFKKYQHKMDSHRPGHENLILGWSNDGQVLLVFSFSDTDPGRYSIFHVGENRLVTFSIINEELTGTELTGTEVVEFEARDGYLLQGYLNKSINQLQGANKLVVIPHGGPWARDDWDFNAHVQFFATRGYSVLRINFRGSTGYGREHLLSGLKSIDSVMIDDIADGTGWAVANGYADPGQVFIFGHSYGGYAALMSTMRYPDLYQAAVSWSAPLDLLAQLKHYKKEDSYFAYEFWKTAVGDPKTEKTMLRRISPALNIDELKSPLLIFHGELDGTIPVEQVESFEKALGAAGNKTEVKIIDNEGHSFHNNNNISYVLEKALRFFSANSAP